MATFPMPTAGQFNMPAFQAFLGQHPAFARLRTGADQQKFLNEHPAIAQRYLALIRPAKATNTVAPATPAQPAAPAAPVNTATPADVSARAVLRSTLDQWGLGALGDWAWDQYVNGSPDAQIFTDLRQRPEYKARFPAMDAMSKKGRAIDETTYISLERSYAQTMRAYGIPAGFYDSPEDFGKLIANDVSAKELDDRVAMAEQVVSTDPRGQQLRTALGSLYGMSNADGLAIAYWIDPDKGSDLIKRQFQAGQAAAAAQATGFGSLDRSQAERAGAVGLSYDQAAQTFSDLATLGELRNPLDAGDQGVSQDTLIAAGFENDAAAKKKIQQSQERRTAAFGGGGGYSASSKGISGLGSAAA